MKLKRLRRAHGRLPDLDEYESTSSSSEIEFVSPPPKRPKQSHGTRMHRTNSPSHGVRGTTKDQSNIHRVPVALSDQSSSNLSSSSYIKSTWKPSLSKNVNNTKTQTDKRKNRGLTALERKKLELEKTRREEMRREESIGFISNQIIDQLVSMGISCRDVAQLCSIKLCWNFTEWKDILKGGKVTIYEPITIASPLNRKRSKLSNKKSLYPHSKTWSPNLEVDALSYCILKSGGIRVELRDGFRKRRDLSYRSKQPEDCELMDEISDLRCVFVHRSVIGEFLLEEKPSVIELTKMEPRLQIFAFGTAQEPASRQTISTNPKVELILCAGTIVIPTFNSLFKKGPGNVRSGKHHFDQLKKLCVFHPFLKVCLHPSMRRQLGNCSSSDRKAADLDADFLFEFLANYDFDHLSEAPSDQTKHLANWVKLDRNNICWLCSDSDESQDQVGDEGEEEAILEVHSIVKTLKEIQKELYVEFRRFIIALPPKHPYSNRDSIEGIELLEISKLLNYNLI